MSELVIREALVFAGAVAGAIWGYCLGRIVERRRIALEVGASLETLERWAIQVCHGLESLEQSLARIGYFYGSDAPARDLAEAKALLSDAKVRVPFTSARR